MTGPQSFMMFFLFFFSQILNGKLHYLGQFDFDNMLQINVVSLKLELLLPICLILSTIFFILLLLILALNQNDLCFILFIGLFCVTINICSSALQCLFSHVCVLTSGIPSLNFH